MKIQPCPDSPKATLGVDDLDLATLLSQFANTLEAHGYPTRTVGCVFRPDLGADSGGTWAGIPE